MSIGQAFQSAAQDGRRAFIPFMTAGFPDRTTCLDLLVALADNGADVIEVGLPFSDPLADGPLIQQSSQTALDQGLTPPAVLDLIADARARINCPLVIMSYWNPIFKMGPNRFATQARDAGATGVIVPDLPLEEAEVWLEVAEPTGLETIMMVAPTTPADRRRRIMDVGRGFLYYVSLTGVTGSSFTVSPELIENLRAVRAESPLPVAVGFGVSRPDQARALARAVDGVIVGSALIKEVLSHQEPAAQVAAVARLAAALSAALGPAEAGKEAS